MVRPRSAAASTCAILPSITKSGFGWPNCSTTQGSSPSPTSKFEPPPRKRCGTQWESSRFRRLGIDSCFVMRSRSVVPPMPSDVSSASDSARRRSIPSPGSAAAILGYSMRMGGRVLCSKQNHEFVACAADVSRADSQNRVEGTRFTKQEFDAFLHGAEIKHVFVPGFENGVGQSLAGDAGNRRLARGVDVGKHNDIGLIESAAEFVPQALCAGIAMRLEEHQQPVEFAVGRGLQCCPNFGRIMAVVLVNRDVVDHAFDVEAPTDPREFSEAFADQLGGHGLIKRDSGGGW